MIENSSSLQMSKIILIFVCRLMMFVSQDETTFIVRYNVSLFGKANNFELCYLSILHNSLKSLGNNFISLSAQFNLLKWKTILLI